MLCELDFHLVVEKIESYLVSLVAHARFGDANERDQRTSPFLLFRNDPLALYLPE